MWKLEFRPAALAWMLGALFAVGLVTLWIERWTDKKLEPSRIVTGKSSDLVQRADSIFLARRVQASGPISINLANAAELEQLPGIGPVLARNIVAYRDRHGNFSSMDELVEVSGIGPKRLEAIRGLCVLDTQARAVSPTASK